ncbi:MAG: glycosyltransferase family 4 protein [bacterium]
MTDILKIAFLHMTMGIVERGSEIVIDNLATELSKKHDVLLIQSGKSTGKSYQVKRVMPFDSAPVPAPSNILNKLLFRLHLDDESGRVAEFTKAALPTISSFNPDIIVAVNGSLQLKILQGQALPAQAGFKAKLVTFGHAGIGYHDRDTLRTCPDLFVALTQTAEVWARQHAPKSTKVKYIPNPIDLKSFKQTKPANLKLEQPIVLTVSALSKYKNVEKVIRAIKQTVSSYLLIGEGEGSETIAKEFGTLANSFVWIKHVEPSIIPSYFLASDVFCFTPDPQEAFGLVYLEAMTAGLPIVASDDPIRRELIGPHGIYVDPRNPDSIARGINQAIQLDKIDYSKELESYDLKTVTKQIEKEFHDLIK